MKKTLTLILGVLVAIPALVFGQVGVDSNTAGKIESQAKIDSANAYNIPGERRFAIVEFVDSIHYNVVDLITHVVMIERDGQITKRDTESDTATLYLPADGSTKYIATMTWHTNTLFDTAYVEKERIDDPARAAARWTNLVNIAYAYPATPKPVYQSSFSYVRVTSSASKAETTFIGDRVEFFSEHYQGHGYVKIFIDDQQVAELYQNSSGSLSNVTDFSRMIPSFGYTFPKAAYNSPPGSHKIRLETAPGNQYLLDFIRVVNYTLTPRIKPKTVPK